LDFTFKDGRIDLESDESMIVCHCKGVTDRTIRNLVREGASSPSDVRVASEAGMCCGGCRPVIDRLVLVEREQSDRPHHELARAV
jgi:bacterioferritin-associated ferredoxin